MDHVAGGLVGGLVAILVNALFLYLAARFFLKKASYVAAIAAAVLGGILVTLVRLGAVQMDWPGWAVLVTTLAAYSLVVAFVFRTQWLVGALIGVAAAVFYSVAAWLVGLAF